MLKIVSDAVAIYPRELGRRSRRTGADEARPTSPVWMRAASGQPAMLYRRGGGTNCVYLA